jgi:uncharacterized protein YpmB
MLDKYGLDKWAAEMSVDAKARLTDALKNAENKVTVGTVISHWREIIILALIVGSLFLYWRMNSAQVELKTKQETFNRLEKIDKIDETLKSVNENIKTLYPQIDDNVKGLDKTRQQLGILTKKIDSTIPVKPVYRDLSAQQVSDELSKLGYKTTVETKGGTTK